MPSEQSLAGRRRHNLQARQPTKFGLVSRRYRNWDWEARTVILRERQRAEEFHILEGRRSLEP